MKKVKKRRTTSGREMISIKTKKRNEGRKRIRETSYENDTYKLC